MATRDRLKPLLQFRNPAKALREEMERCEFTPAQMAKAMGISRQQVYLLLRGSRFSAAQAVKLEQIFDIPASQWLALQVEVDLAVARGLQGRD